MIHLYDEALSDYFKTSFNDNITITPVADYWRVVSMHKEGELQLPAICLSRQAEDKDAELRSWIIERKGRTDRVQDHKLITEQALPLGLNYNITLLATTQEDIDELTSEVIFLIINRPSLEVKIPYGSERYTNAQISLDGEVRNDSAVDTFTSSGILYQAIIPIKILGANIFNIEKRNLRYLKWDIRPDIIK